MKAVSRLWLGAGSVAVLLVLSFTTYNLVGLLAQGDRTLDQRFTAAELTSLDVDVENGEVAVTGGDVTEVHVVADISDGLRPTRYSATVRGGTLHVRSECPYIVPTNCDASVTIVVPRTLPVVIDADDGAVTVRSLDSPVQVSSSNGALRLDDLGGDLTVDARNGRVTGTGLRSSIVNLSGTNGRQSLTFATPPTFVRAASVNGAVEVVVPNTEDAYRVSVDSRNGREDTAVRTDPSSTRSIRVGTTNGSATVRYPDG